MTAISTLNGYSEQERNIAKGRVTLAFRPGTQWSNKELGFSQKTKYLVKTHMIWQLCDETNNDSLESSQNRLIQKHGPSRFGGT